MSSYVSFLPSPQRMSADRLRRMVVERSGNMDVRGAFPVVLARTWRLRLGELTGHRRYVPGKPLIAAAVGNELWVYSCGDQLEIRRLLAKYPAAFVSPVDGVDNPTVTVGARTLQLPIDWFDEARYALALMRPR